MYHRSLASKVTAQFPTPSVDDDSTKRSTSDDGIAKVFYQCPVPRPLRFCTSFPTPRVPHLISLVCDPHQNQGHVCPGGLGMRLTEHMGLPIFLPRQSELGGAVLALWKVTASFPNYHIWGNRWESMWRNCGLLLKGGRCFLKKVATKRFYPVVPKALGIWRHLVNRMLFFFPLFAEEETVVRGGRMDRS